MKSAWLTIFLIVFLVLATFGLGYNYFFRPIWKQWQANQPMNELSIPRQVASGSAQNLKNGLVATMSAQEKIAQLLVLPVSTLPGSSNSVASQAANVVSKATAAAAPTGTTVRILDPATETWLKTYKPGFVQLVGVRASSTSATVQPLTWTAAEATVQALNLATAELPWPPLKLVRHAGGNEQILRGTGFTKLPTMAQLCASANKYEPALAQSAAELGKLKIALVIGPVVDLQSGAGSQGDQLCADPAEAALAASKYIENFGTEGIMPVLAHFPGIGQAKQDPRVQTQTLAVTISELKPFQQLLKVYPNLGVLVSPVKVAEKFAGQPCVLSQECLATFGKDYAQALVVADALPARTLTLNETIKQSLLAGNHVVILDTAVALPELTQALQQLTLEYQQNEAFRRAVDLGWQHVHSVRTGGQ